MPVFIIKIDFKFFTLADFYDIIGAMSQKYSYQTPDKKYVELKRYYLNNSLTQGFRGFSHLPLMDTSITQGLNEAQRQQLQELCKTIPKYWPKVYDYLFYLQECSVASPVSTKGFHSALRNIDKLSMLIPLLKELTSLLSPHIEAIRLRATSQSQFCYYFHEAALDLLNQKILLGKTYKKQEIVEFKSDSSFMAKIAYVKNYQGKAGFLAPSGRIVPKIQNAKMFMSEEEINGYLISHTISPESINIIDAKLEISGLSLKVDSSDNEDMIKAEKFWLQRSIQTPEKGENKPSMPNSKNKV